MKNLKKWLLVFCMAGPTVVHLSCSGAFLQQFRDAAIAGAANFVEEAAYNLLDQAINLDGTDE